MDGKLASKGNWRRKAWVVNWCDFVTCPLLTADWTLGQTANIFSLVDCHPPLAPSLASQCHRRDYALFGDVAGHSSNPADPPPFTLMCVWIQLIKSSALPPGVLAAPRDPVIRKDKIETRLEWTLIVCRGKQRRKIAGGTLRKIRHALWKNGQKNAIEHIVNTCLIFEHNTSYLTPVVLNVF